jgi:photosystem II stability/assembly factor-like uncharacterized protein
MAWNRSALVFGLLILGPTSALSQSQWIPGSLGHPGFMRAVQVHSVEQAWTATSNNGGAVFATSDGGATWARTDTSEFPDRGGFHDLSLVPSGTLLAVASWHRGAMIVRSTDGGVTWQETFRHDSSFINGVRMTSETDGVAVGDPFEGYWVVLLTTDGGLTWHPAPSAPPQAMGPGGHGEHGYENSIAALPGGNFWFGTDNSSVYRSTDGGASWSYGAIPSFDAYGVAFSEPLTGVAACGNGLARTTDGGVTWTHIPAGFCNDVFGIQGYFWAVQGRDILESTDNGATWDTAYTGTGYFERVHATLDGDMIVGWAVGGGQTVKFTVLPAGMDEEAGRDIPRTIRLHQNFPNPFNPTTTIRYELPARAFVTLTVYNMVGHRVATLVDGDRPAGYHEVRFDATGLASGVYPCRLQAGGLMQARRLLLLK